MPFLLLDLIDGAIVFVLGLALIWHITKPEEY
jgi:hypothetical protein